MILSIPNKSCPLPAGSKVFTYARDSGGDTQERSVDEQIRLYDAYAEQHGLIILRHFHDRARPGSSMIGRDGLEQLLAEARRQPRAGDGILFWSMDRLSRNQLESQYLKADLRLHGYKLIFISNDIPDVGDLSPVFESLLEWKAAEDLRAISRNAKRGLMDLVARKKPDGSFEGFMPGVPPRGYKGETVAIGMKRTGQPRLVQRWVKDPKWWKKCREAWRLRADGWTVADVHRKLGIYQSSTCYTTFFRNAIYKGELHYGGQVFKDFVPRMVDDAVWAKVQRMHDVLKKHAPARVDSKRLFAGLAFCAVCGSPLRGFDYRKNGKILYRYYGCSGRGKKSCRAPMIPADPFEREVMEKVSDRILTPATLRLLSEATRIVLRNRNNQADGVIDLLKDDLRSAEKGIANLVKSVEQAPLSAALGKALEDQETRAAEARARIAELQTAKREQAQIPEYSDADLRALGDRLRAALLRPTPEARAVLQGFVVRIVAEKKRAAIYYVFPIEDGAAEPGGASVSLLSARSPVGAPAERRISIEWILRPETKRTRNDEIRARRRAGGLHREIAQEFGISLQRVGQISGKKH
jgi:DNA invertase Pin-like site-specific DNA recombinase